MVAEPVKNTGPATNGSTGNRAGGSGEILSPSDGVISPGFPFMGLFTTKATFHRLRCRLKALTL
jgi:hypothetical protein